MSLRAVSGVERLLDTTGGRACGALGRQAGFAGVSTHRRCAGARATSSLGTTKRANLQGVNGACGTRTRHLRLAKLYSASRVEPGQAGITGESRPFVRGLAGIAGSCLGL